jgi:glycosyltransferase involved in cell wall biosynthesis
LKIVRMIARLNVGGPARHVVLLNGGLDRRGHATVLVHGEVAPGEASLEQSIGPAGIRAVKLPALGRRISVMSDVMALWQLTALLFRERPDVVHTHTAKAGTLGRIAATLYNLTRRKRFRAAIVHTFHGHVLDGYFHPVLNRVVRWVERRLAALSDRIVTISPGQRRDLVTRFRVADERQTAVIPLGLELEALASLAHDASSFRQAVGIPPDDIVVGYLGRFAPIKDLPTLFRAAAGVIHSRPDVWLVLAGDGPSRPELEALARQLDVASRVRFLGWTDDLPRFYATIDCLALSSRNEGTPVAIIEAMAAGRAVAATAVGGVPDVLEEGVTGLLVPPGRAEPLTEALVRLVADRDERLRMGAAARRLVISRYSVGRLVTDVERLYGSVLAERRGGV